MGKKRKLLINTVMGVVQQLVTVICGFILPRFFLKNYGSEVNGLITSLTQFLSFISLLEMGIGPVVQANLYKPLSEKNLERISEIVKSSERFFRKIACVFLVYIVALSVIFPISVAAEFDPWFTVSLLLIIAISTFTQYFFGATYHILLNSDQKSYVHMSIQTVAVIINTAISIVLMHMGAPVHAVKLISATIFVFRPLLMMTYVRKRYKLNMNIQLIDEPIKQKWNGFAQHVASTVSANANTVILSFFSSLSNISIYSVYNMVTGGLTNIIATGYLGVDSYFGNVISRNDENEIRKSFEFIELVTHGIVTVIFTIAAISMIPFVTVYTKDIHDANYIQPKFGILLVAAFMVRCIRMPYHSIINAAGHFKETQTGSFIMVAINIILSTALVFVLGLPGVAIGLLVSMLFHVFYFVWYLKSNIIHRPIYVFIKYLISDIFIAIISVLASQIISFGEPTWINFFLYLIKSGFITLGISILMNIIFNFRMVKSGFRKLLFRTKNK